MKPQQIHIAIEIATLAHQGQVRKGTSTPYIVHPFEVAQILTATGCNEHTIIAGLFHDLLEDTHITAEEIRSQFGARVTEIVLACTEQQHGIWESRKAHTIRYMYSCTDLEILQVSCADKLSNLRSIKSDYLRSGEHVWNRFRRTKDKIDWYYCSLIEAYKPHLANYSMFKELSALHKDLF